MSKRQMTKDEKMLVDALVSHGCIICGKPAEFHHLPEARPNALAIGYPLCDEHHRGEAFPGQSIHSSRLLFTQTHGSELELLQRSLIKVFNRSIPF